MSFALAQVLVQLNAGGYDAKIPPVPSGDRKPWGRWRDECRRLREQALTLFKQDALGAMGLGNNAMGNRVWDSVCAKAVDEDGTLNRREVLGELERWREEWEAKCKGEWSCR